MYCESCGSKLGEHIKYCENCGESINNLTDTKSNLLDKVDISFQRKGVSISRVKMIFSVVGIAFIAFIFLSIFGFTDNEYVRMVKNGSLSGYPNVKVGQAFEEYFANTTWEYFESTEGEDVVEFNGKCLFLDEKVEVTMQFIVDLEDEMFHIDYFALDDVSSFLMLSGLLDAVMESYSSR